MDSITPDEVYEAWTTPELLGMYLARVRTLLTQEVQQAPRTILRRQERLVVQARRLLRQRGMENPSMR